MPERIDVDLYGMVQRVAKLETLIEVHARNSQEFRESTTTRMDRMADQMGDINRKLDVIANKIILAETAVKGGAGLVGWVVRQVPGVSIGGAVAWAAAHFWPGK